MKRVGLIFSCSAFLAAFAVFVSNQSCGTESLNCGCDRIVADTFNSAARQPLECGCDLLDPEPLGEKCDRILEQEIAAECSVGRTVIRISGCGRVELDNPSDFSGLSLIFSASTSALVGITAFNDVPWGACDTFDYVYGEPSMWGGLDPSFVCSEKSKCTICGPSQPDAPPCSLPDGGVPPFPDAGDETGTSSCPCEREGDGQFIHQPIECFCASRSGAASGDASNEAGIPAICARDFTQESASRCAAGQTVRLLKGCDRVEILGELGSGQSLVYDASTGSLIGVYEYRDIGVSGACGSAYGYLYGDGLFESVNPWLRFNASCAQIEGCTLCGGGPGDVRCGPG